MKQIFTSAAILLGGILASGSASAAIPGIISKNDIPDWKVKIQEMRKSHSSASTRSAEAPGTVITEAPEGMPMPCMITYSGFFLNMDHIEFMDNLIAPTEVVYAMDGSVYVKDLLPMIPTEAYIKGDYTEEGNIEFKFPQTILAESDPDYGDMWMDLTLVHSSDLQTEIPTPVAENNSIVFTVNFEDMSMVMNPLPEGTSLATVIYPDDMWYGFSVTAISITPGNGDKEGVELPEGVESKPYSYIYDNSFDSGGVVAPGGKPDYGYHVNVAFDKDDVYLGGIFYDAPDSWVKGRKEGNKLIIPGKQYLGTMSGIMDFYLMYAKWETAAHEKLVLLPLDTEFVFEYDETACTLKTVDKDVILLINASDEVVKALQMVEDPTYIYQPDASGAPMAPWGLEYDAKSSYGIFDFNLPKVTDDGVLLFSENMYYNIYVDGELLTFYADENPDFKVDTSDIPYYMDETSVVCEKSTTWHELIVPLVGIETVGVQCVNVWEGEKYPGTLMLLNIATGEVTTGVECIGASEGESSVTYYDLSGRKVAMPAEGIYITRRTYSDGTVKVAKEVVR